MSLQDLQEAFDEASASARQAQKERATANLAYQEACADVKRAEVTRKEAQLAFKSMCLLADAADAERAGAYKELNAAQREAKNQRREEFATRMAAVPVEDPWEVEQAKKRADAAAEAKYLAEPPFNPKEIFGGFYEANPDKFFRKGEK